MQVCKFLQLNFSENFVCTSENIVQVAAQVNQDSES